MPLASGFPSSGTHCSSPQARLQRSPVRGKPTVQLVEWFTVIAAGDGVKQCSGATGGLVAAISEQRMAECGRIGGLSPPSRPWPADRPSAATWRRG